ncbi:hypothetical protein Tco_1037855, partial [Tanacetum coccineum]
MLDKGLIELVRREQRLAPSTCCGPDVCDIRTSYVNRLCTGFDGDSAALCLLRRLATPDCLRDEGVAAGSPAVLQETYDKVDEFVVYNLLQKINTVKQSGSGVPDYQRLIYDNNLLFSIMVQVLSNDSDNGTCGRAWSGFSWAAFSNLWRFVKLSLASDVMLWLLPKSVQIIGGYASLLKAIDIRQLDVKEDDSLNAELEKTLCMVALEGHWWKAKAILRKYKDAATNPVSDNGNTLFHLV